MSTQNWDERYQTNDLPWDTGEPEKELALFIKKQGVTPCKALEVGCGTGTNAVWLAGQGFEVVGVDIAPSAIEIAKQKLVESRKDAAFYAVNFLEEPVPGCPFKFVFDRGCFHSFDSPEERSSFAASVAKHLEPDGLWLSLIGSADDAPRDIGPPMRSATDIVLAVESHFEILELTATTFSVTRPQVPRAWRCVMRKRNEIKYS